MARRDLLNLISLDQDGGRREYIRPYADQQPARFDQNNGRCRLIVQVHRRNHRHNAKTEDCANFSHTTDCLFV
jgi:hypothetical protein